MDTCLLLFCGSGRFIVNEYISQDGISWLKETEISNEKSISWQDDLIGEDACHQAWSF